MNKHYRFGMVHSRFNETLSARLVEGAEHFFKDQAVASERLIRLAVPGAFELPLGAKWLIDQYRSSGLVGLVALGVVIRGETPHFNYVAEQSARGIMQVSLESAIPIGYGVITADDYDQAERRASLDRLAAQASEKTGGLTLKNNGYQAAAALWQMVLARDLLAERVS